MSEATTQATPEPRESLLRTADVAVQLGMSREQVWRLWTAGRLPGYKFDRYLRFSPRDIDAFLRDHYRDDAKRVHRGMADASHRTTPSTPSPSPSPRYHRI